MQKFYLTTAIAYASRKPHFGNTYEIIMTDVRKGGGSELDYKER